MQYFKVILAIFLCSFSVLTQAQTIKLKTENYPPYNLADADGNIVGISTEIVETLFARASVPYEMEVLPWQRAYGLALEESDHAVFSTTRTEAREPLFKWVGPITANNWVFLKKGGSDVVVNTLEDAKKYRVGGYRGDAVSLYLESQGFTIDYVNKDYLNARKIDRDRIDLWATGQLLGPYYARENGVWNLEEVMTFRETIMSIAFNKNTSDDLVNKLNQELALMVSEGVLDQINSKYK